MLAVELRLGAAGRASQSNRLHYVCALPRNLARLTNTAIPIIRCLPQFPYVPVASRHYANRTDEALALLPGPPR